MKEDKEEQKRCIESLQKERDKGIFEVLSRIMEYKIINNNWKLLRKVGPKALYIIYTNHKYLFDYLKNTKTLYRDSTIRKMKSS